MEPLSAQEEEDEWMLRSLRLYGDLHDFELQAPTRVIEWAPGSRLCVAGYGQAGGNEILQLVPPPSLQLKGTQGLLSERDFKVQCGGFSQRPVYNLKHLPGTSLLVTSGPPDSSLQLWQVPAEDSADLLRCVSSIAAEQGAGQPWARINTHASRAAWVLHGASLGSVRVTDVQAQKCVYRAACSSSESLSGLAFLDPSSLLLCSSGGQLCLADCRQQPPGPLQPLGGPWLPPGHPHCSLGVRNVAGGSSLLLALLSSRGHLALADLRKASEPLASACCRVPCASPDPQLLCVSWAPALDGCLAVSGFDGTVQLYSTQAWGSSAGEVEAFFTHQGHTFGGASSTGDPPLVTTHSWHPDQPRTLLSAATNGSLQAWDWLQPADSSG
ncbi:WD repeat-containing protein 73 isoform X1 [Melanerpes formicivorus]|uniref:WD repeat-containing protein 73 isoform X1 n=1 Tax=Melanerpes formicivorus TaxID=211600 RepID=UPI00358EE460